MGAAVDAEVQALEGGGGEGADGLLPQQREHGPVVVGVGVAVEEHAATRTGEGVKDGEITAFADVGDARQHQPGDLAEPARRFSPVGGSVRDMFAFLEGPELIIVLVIVLLVFGGSQVPKLARSLGQAQKEFKKGLNEGAKDDDADPAKGDTAK
jgi:sec-independent protein translocase protein TatA